MIDEEKQTEFNFDDTEASPIAESTAKNELAIVDLNKESLDIINQIVAENDIQKTKDLTYLFNINQNKKTLVRVNKLNDLLDAMTEAAVMRFTARPDEISNKELFDGLKTVQELIERGQKQVTGVQEAPLIQINQQNNEVNVGGENNLSRESKNKVKNAVMSLLNTITADNSGINTDKKDIIDVETIGVTKHD